MNIHTIRLANSNDSAGILEIYAPFILNSTTTFEVDIPSTDEIANRINKYLEKGPWLVSVHNGLITGYAYASEHRSRAAYQWSIELSVYIHPDHQGNKLATRLYQCALEILHRQGYCNIYAGITQPNEPSDAFHRSMGFELIGTYNKIGYKQGKWCDVKWYQRSLNKFNLAPKPIIDLKTLKDSGRLDDILEYHNSIESVENQ